jgi:hypothetical protein
MEWASVSAVLSPLEIAETLRKSLAVSRLVGATVGALGQPSAFIPPIPTVLIEGESIYSRTPIAFRS